MIRKDDSMSVFKDKGEVLYLFSDKAGCGIYSSDSKLIFLPI